MGRIVAFVIGFLVAVAVIYDANQAAVQRGWIVLDNRTYRLTDISPDIH